MTPVSVPREDYVLKGAVLVGDEFATIGDRLSTVSIRRHEVTKRPEWCSGWFKFADDVSWDLGCK